MEPGIEIWSKDYKEPYRRVANDDAADVNSAADPAAIPSAADPAAFDPDAGAPEMEQPQLPQRPGKFKMGLLIAGQIALGLLRLGAQLLMKAVGLGLFLFGTGMSKLKNRASNSSSGGKKKKMGLRAVFLGAALVTGGMMAPGAYYMTQPNEIVRTRVTGKVEADAKAEFPGQKYVVYTNQGKFDTYGVQGGAEIKEGCVYDFNVKSARLNIWPPGYTRSIVSYKPVDGGCKP